MIEECSIITELFSRQCAIPTKAITRQRYSKAHRSNSMGLRFHQIGDLISQQDFEVKRGAAVDDKYPSPTST